MSSVSEQRVIMQNLSLVTAPAENPLTVLDARDQSRVTWPDEDALIGSYLYAATAHLDGRDGILARALMAQTWDYTLPCFPPDDFILLPLAPVQSITSITYKDGAGADQTFAGANYALSADLHWRPRVRLAYGQSWPGTRDEPDAVKVRAVYGYALVPPELKQAILLLAAHWYDNREPVNIGNITTELPFGVRALIEPYMRTVF